MRLFLRAILLIAAVLGVLLVAAAIWIAPTIYRLVHVARRVCERPLGRPVTRFGVLMLGRLNIGERSPHGLRA